KDQGNDESKDSDADPSTGKSDAVSLSAGENNPDVDAGVYPLVGAIGDTVWMDENMNGLQDEDHPMEGIHVILRDADGKIVDQTDTDANGHYEFDNLDAGDYVVEFPEGYYYTQPHQGDDPAVDSDVDRNTHRSGVIHLDQGERIMDVDAGIEPVAHIGDYVWIDENDNGIQDPGEKAVAGAIVELYDADGNPITDIHGNHSVTTDANGRYGFDVEPGKSYRLRFRLPQDLQDEGYVFTQHVAGNERSNSDVGKDGYTLVQVTPRAGQNILTLDAGVSCGCKGVGGGSGSAMGLLGGTLMTLLGALLALVMIRKEEQKLS
ncbi:SdrD B-like domain-containing protein, partial [Nitratifractor sp.]